MSNILKIALLASIGGVIGYITNVLAIKLIFRPIEPIKIPILNFEIIGLIPKRRNEISKNIGEIIQEEFLSMDDILSNIMNEDDKENITEYIKEKIKNIAQEKMSFVPFPIRGMIEGYIMDAVDVEVKAAIDELSEDIMNKAKERINIQEYLDMIKRRKWIIISILLLSLALGGFRMYQNYVSYVPTYTSSVMVKVDTMKVQKEEAAKEREKESKKGSKKNSKDNTDTSSYGQTANNGTGQSTEGYNLYNYSAIAQDESIASRYYTYAADSAAYDKVAQVAGVRASKVMSISASQSEDRLEEINITVTSSDAKSAQLIAAAMPKVYGDLLLKETGIDCVSTVYDATPGVRSHRRVDTSVPIYGLGGLVIAIFIVLLLEILNTKIITPDDVEKYWELPLLGVVPAFDEGPHSKKKKRK